MTVRDETRHDTSKRVSKRSAFMYIVTRFISADYFPSGGVIATLLGNCKVLCYANMNVTYANMNVAYGPYC